MVYCKRDIMQITTAKHFHMNPKSAVIYLIMLCENIITMILCIENLYMSTYISSYTDFILT